MAFTQGNDLYTKLSRIAPHIRFITPTPSQNNCSPPNPILIAHCTVYVDSIQLGRGHE